MAPIEYSKLHILVVEDEKFTRDLTCALLHSIGVASIAACEDGRSGLLELLRTRPDMVFCDVRMVGMDGRQFLNEVRAIKVGELSRTPIVFLTADSTVETDRRHAGDGYLVKPVSRAQLRDRIDAIVLANRL